MIHSPFSPYLSRTLRPSRASVQFHAKSQKQLHNNDNDNDNDNAQTVPVIQQSPSIQGKVSKFIANYVESKQKMNKK